MRYDAKGFRSANMFVLRSELASVVAASTNPLLRELFASDLAPAATKKGGRGKASVSRQYRTQLGNLIHLIASTNAHYIRCVRPNASQAPNLYNDDQVLLQLASLGILATVQIRQAALPLRFTYAAFYERFWSVAGYEACQLDAGEDGGKATCNEMAHKLAAQADLDLSERQYFAFGRDLFYSSQAFYRVCEELRAQYLDDLERRRIAEEAERLAAQRRGEQEEAARRQAELEALRLAEEEERLRLEVQQRSAEEEHRRQEEERLRMEELLRKKAEAERRLKEEQERAAEAERQRLEELRRLQEEWETAERARRAEEEALRQAELSKQQQEAERLREERERSERRLKEERERAELERLRREQEAEAQRREAERHLQELQLAAEAAERQRLAEEQRLKDELERRLRENQSARGFMRPPPLDANSDWRAQVLGAESRKAKEGKKVKEVWVRIKITCGRETWEISKSLLQFQEFHSLLLTDTLRAGIQSSKGLTPILDQIFRDRDPVPAVQAYMDFLMTDPKLWNYPRVRRFLLAGLNNVDAAAEWLRDALHSGTLVKKKGEKQGLQKKLATRWCCISRRTLYYYAKKDDANPRGIIALDGSIVAPIGAALLDAKKGAAAGAGGSRVKKGPTSFKLIQNDGTNYLFTCSDDADCKKWVDCISSGNAAVQRMVQPVDGRLEVEIIAGRELMGTLENGLSNPFVIAYVEGQQIETKMVSATLNPVWRDVFPEQAEPTPTCVILDQKSLVWFTVWSRGPVAVSGSSRSGAFMRHTFLGMAVLPVSSLPNGAPFDAWIPLAPRAAKENITGQIRVALTHRWSPAAKVSESVSVAVRE